MLAESPGIERESLVDSLRLEWGIAAVSLQYQAVGFGTHHYHVRDSGGGEWFVNVDELATKTSLAGDDRDAVSALDAALRTAVALRDAGLEFVHAPLPARDGRALAPMAGGFAVSVYTYIEGSSNPYGEFPSDELRRRVLAALGRMHAATGAVPAGLPRRDTLVIPQRDAFDESLDRVAATWTGGPLAEPARQMIQPRVGAIRDLFARYDELVESVVAAAAPWTVTHGEPHAANVMLTSGGAMKLIDWDTAALGPRERDLWMVEPRTDADWKSYTSTGGAPEIDSTAIALYRLWWTLAEIAGYTVSLRSPHEDNPNTRAALANLLSYLP